MHYASIMQLACHIAFPAAFDLKPKFNFLIHFEAQIKLPAYHFPQLFSRAYLKIPHFLVLHLIPALSVPFYKEIPTTYDQKSRNEDLMKNTTHRCNTLEICRGRAPSPNGSKDNSYLCYNHI